MPVHGSIDTPTAGQAAFGVHAVQGWVLGDAGAPAVEVRIDGQPVTSAVDRFPRPDVARAFPRLAPANPRPGFAVCVNTAHLPNGTHELTAAAGPPGAARPIGRVAFEVANRPEAAFFRRVCTAPDPGYRRRKLRLLLEILACPRCRGTVTAEADGHLRCHGCAFRYAAADGVPVMVAGDPAYPVDPEQLDSPPSNNPYPPPLWRLLDEHLARSALVLDLGSGRRSFGADRLIQLEICAYPFTDVVSQGEELPFRDEAFDFVFSRAVTEHVRRPWVLAAEMQRVLKPGGLLLADSAFLQPLHGYPSHYFNMTAAGLGSLFPHLQVESLRPEPHQHPWFAVSWILDRVLADLPPVEREMLAAMPLGHFLDEMKAYCAAAKDYGAAATNVRSGGLPSLGDARMSELAAGYTLVGRKT